MMHYNPLNLETFEQEESENPFGKPVMLDDLTKNLKNAVGQPCGINNNDAGTPGDAGNSTTTAKSIGNNPTTSFTGCADQTDEQDWYEFTMEEDHNVEVLLSNFGGSNASDDQDFDMGIYVDDPNIGTGFITVAANSRTTTERVSTVNTQIDGLAGTYWIVVVPYNDGAGTAQGDYDVNVWTNYTESCLDWNDPQNDANTGQDAPQNWTDSPTNMGNNITSSYSGCLDKYDSGDVLAFDVPVNHTITVILTLEDEVDLDLFLHEANGSVIDDDTFGVRDVTTSGTTFEDQPGTYYVNVTHQNGNGNYTIEVFTNYSIPFPNLAIDGVTVVNQVVNPGDVVPFDVTVINDGTLDVTNTFMAEVILSEDTGNTWVDHNLGNATWSNGLAINATQTLTINGTIPTNIVEGEYRVFVVLDSDENITELEETDNQITSQTLDVGNSVNACETVQNDALSGKDAGEEVNTSIDLGLKVDLELRGCIDSSDRADMYKITVSPNQSLDVTLVSPPISGADFDLELRLPNGTIIYDSELSIDDFVTLEGTDYENTSGDYYLYVEYWPPWSNTRPGGTYRLLIGEPDQSTYVVPFSCRNQNDLGQQGDADGSAGEPLGTNFNASGTGCLSNTDTRDVYTFGMEGFKNVEINFNASTSLPFTASLTNSADTEIATIDNTSYGLLFESFGNEMYEGQDNTFTLAIDSNGGEGTYELDISFHEPALPDLIHSALICPTTDTFTDEDIAVQWVINNSRGPGDGAVMNVVIELIDSNNETVSIIYSSETESENPVVTDAMSYNRYTVQESYQFFTIPTNTSSGDYRCKIIIDADGDVPEINESNNIHFSEPFPILNEAELWANDGDRDGFNSTDAGDGIIDDCPDNPGSSTVDRYGCPDLDNDGVSNDNDILPIDKTQWYDSDGDGFGDNPVGTNGDQCPDLVGVFNGDDGVGCPVSDLDFDGVLNENDACPDTPPGTIVGADGCGLPEEPADNTTDPTDSTGVTPPTDNADDTSSGDGATEASDDTESESGLFGMSYTVIGLIGVVVVLSLLTLLFVRGRGSKNDDAFAMQEKAYAAAGFAAIAGAGAADASITPEQLAYEQQLIASGYPADYARAYADQHFRPWLKQ